MDSYVRKIVGLRNIRISGGEVLWEELVERGGIITDEPCYTYDSLLSDACTTCIRAIRAKQCIKVGRRITLSYVNRTQTVVRRAVPITDIARWPIAALVSSTRGHQDWT
jgi:hypothetical protein